MRRLLIIISLSLLTLNGYSQMGEWTWMNGDSASDAPEHFGIPGVFDPIGHLGTKGVFDQNNSPPGFYEACQWTDKNGNFWLYGGSCLDTSLTNLEYGDLWEFNPTINQWAWINGPGIPNQSAVYGTKGIPSPTNNPGARSLGIQTWVDANGNLWLYGGLNFQQNFFNDLWEYDISTNEWTWMSGINSINQPEINGTLGLEDSINNPGGRGESNATWTDNNNNLWLYGGYGIDHNSKWGALGDLWKFNISSNLWTWISGADTCNQPPVYGTKGVPDISNTPGSRWCYSVWKDCNDDLWLFGGSGTGGGGNLMNDLWRYNITTNQWIWISGTNVLNDTGTSSLKCNPSINNIPSSRMESRTCWNIDCDNFELFGGFYLGFPEYYFQDIWNYKVSTNEWTLMRNDIRNDVNTTHFGNYGTKTISNNSNYPGGRFGSIGWKDNSGNLWMFGGQAWGGSGWNSYYFNDIWRFVPDTNCLFNLSNLSIPNVFTPNGDGKNDYFGFEIGDYTNYHLLIFNRWGQKLFESTNQSNQWNGRINNTAGEAPDGTCYYLLTLNDLTGKPYPAKVS